MIPPVLLFFLNIVSGIHGFLCLHTNFKIIFSGFVKIVVCDKIAWNLWLSCVLQSFWQYWFFQSKNTFSSVQLLSRVRLFATPWITARQASLSITNSRRSLRFTSIESVMPSSHLILSRPLLLLLPIPPSIRVYSNESTLRMRWPKYWSFSFSIIPSIEIPGPPYSNYFSDTR